MPRRSRLAHAAALAALAAVAALTACKGQPSKPQQVSGEEVGDQLDKAADQSAPAARQVLRGAADEARAHESLAPAGAPGSLAQDAMEKAGKAEASSSHR